jgi:beta-galactosidase
VGTPERRYDGEAARYYNGLKALQRNIDVVSRTAEVSGYRLVVAPNLHLVDDEMVARLSRFVSGGGILVLNYRAGTQNTDASVRRVLPPGVFAKMAGVTVESCLDLVEFPTVDRGALGIDLGGSFHPRTILEQLKLEGAEPVAKFTGGRMAGQAAVIRNRYGNGWVFYVGTDCDDVRFYEAVARSAGGAGKIAPLIEAPNGVEVVTRETVSETYYFLLNLTENAYEEIRLPEPMQDLLTERQVKAVSVGPLEVSVLVRQTAP